ncbi:MAG: hypothetical protein QM756_37760 [Polyangiaceae bacterium]
MSQRFWPVGSLMLLLACAESAPPKTADAEDASASASQSETPAAKPEAEPASAPAASEASGPAAPEDVQAVLQLVLDDDALTPYLHLDRPDRFPVRISGPDLGSGIELTKATKPVVVVPQGENDKKPTIAFTEVKITGDEASVRFRYDVEGVRGSASLKRRDKQWVLVRSRVSEH